MLSRTIGQKALGKLYNFLLGLGIMMDVETLKCDSQWSNLMHALVMSIDFLKHVMSLTYLLRCLHNNLSGSRVYELLHFIMELVNSSSENGLYFITCLLGISFSKSKSIWWFWAVLSNICRACHKSLSLMHEWPLCWIASMAGSFHFLT